MKSVVIRTALERETFKKFRRFYPQRGAVSQVMRALIEKHLNECEETLKNDLERLEDGESHEILLQEAQARNIRTA